MNTCKKAQFLLPRMIFLGKGGVDPPCGKQTNLIPRSNYALLQKVDLLSQIEIWSTISRSKSTK